LILGNEKDIYDINEKEARPVSGDHAGGKYPGGFPAFLLPATI
jgi:hypothetical protein